MVTRAQSIKNFSCKMDKLIESSYILTTSKIAEVIKALTSSKMFFELITFCMDGFDFDAKLEEYEQVGGSFPVDNKKDLIAFGFCLLAAIDAKQIELLDVLNENYKCDNVERSYKAFALMFLTPFKFAVTNSAEQMISGLEDLNGDPEKFKGEAFNQMVQNIPENKKLAPENEKSFGYKRELVYDEEAPRKNYLTCYSDIQRILTEEKSRIIRSRFKDGEKQDLLMLLESFRDCLFKGNKEQVKTTFVSYKYAIKNYRRVDSEVEDIERILKFCGIL